MPCTTTPPTLELPRTGMTSGVLTVAFIAGTLGAILVATTRRRGGL